MYQRERFPSARYFSGVYLAFENKIPCGKMVDWRVSCVLHNALRSKRSPISSREKVRANYSPRKFLIPILLECSFFESFHGLLICLEGEEDPFSDMN